MKLSALTLFTLASVTAFAGASAHAEGEGALKIKGFVDAQYKWQKSQAATTGAVINDGALYFSHSTGDTELFVDLPFRWSGNAADVNNDGLIDANDNNFVVGQSKAQAYLAHKIGDTKIQFGQFDTIYGFELNDSPDYAFTSQGALFNNLLPFTHTGALVTQTIGPVTVKAMAANTFAGKGDAGAQLNGHGEYGATVGFANEMFRASAGYLTGRITNSPGDKSRNFTDLLVGGTFGPVAIDVEYSIEKIADQDQGTALMILPVYNVTPEFSVAARYEMLDKVGGYDKINQFTGGVQYALNTALKLKLDYTTVKNTDKISAGADAGTDTDDSLFAFAAVYKF